MNKFINDNICIILVYAREREKWVAVKDLVKYGLTMNWVRVMEDHGLVNVRKDDELGWLIKLTAKGYRRCKYNA
jgi:hypothetical protein